MVLTKTSPVTKKFDVFARTNKAAWAYECTVEAASPEEAKRKAMEENPKLKNHLTAVYPKK